MRQALESLADEGAQRVAMVEQEGVGQDGCPSTFWQPCASSQRERGHQPGLLLRCKPSVRAACEAPLPAPSQMEAAPGLIYCSADRQAVGVLLAACPLGVSVPEQMGVLGAANSSDGFELARPLNGVGMSDRGIETVLGRFLRRPDAPPASVITSRWRLSARKTTRAQ